MQTASKKEKIKKTKQTNNNHLKDITLFMLGLWTAADANLNVDTHCIRFHKDNKVQPVQSSRCLNTPKSPSYFLEVISDQTGVEEHMLAAV